MIVIANQDGKTMVSCRLCGRELSFNKGGRAPLVSHAISHGIKSKTDLDRALAAGPTDTNLSPPSLQHGTQRTLDQVTLF